MTKLPVSDGAGGGCGGLVARGVFVGARGGRCDLGGGAHLSVGVHGAALVAAEV